MYDFAKPCEMINFYETVPINEMSHFIYSLKCQLYLISFFPFGWIFLHFLYLSQMPIFLNQPYTENAVLCNNRPVDYTLTVFFFWLSQSSMYIQIAREQNNKFVVYQSWLCKPHSIFSISCTIWPCLILCEHFAIDFFKVILFYWARRWRNKALWKWKE